MHLLKKKIREAMAKEKKTIADQKNRKTGRPTIRWVFQVFEGILYLAIKNDDDKIIISTTNVKEDHRTILSCLGPPYKKIYFL